jgi:hypothetical protein
MTTPREFERLSRYERQATLKFVADRDGIESALYRALANKPGWLLKHRSQIGEQTT